MVDAHDVHELQEARDALHPPGEAVFSHRVPIVKRVAPKLAVLAEIIGRHARDFFGAAVLAQGEKFRVRPDVGAVLREVQRHIPEDADAL